jgi:hypothetical protein
MRLHYGRAERLGDAERVAGGLTVESGSVTLTDTLLMRNVAALNGGAVYGLGLQFRNCTMKDNSATYEGGALAGGANFEDCVLIRNFATDGGTAYATAPITSLARCIVAEGGVSQQGAAVYSPGATAIEVRDSLVRGFAADASGDATTLVYAHGSSALAVLDRVTWSNNELAAVASTNDATVMVRNVEGLSEVDVQAAALLSCKLQRHGHHWPLLAGGRVYRRGGGHHLLLPPRPRPDRPRSRRV